MIDPKDKERASGGAKIMKDSKFAEAVRKFGRGIVFVGGGILFCVLLLGLGILYAGFSLAFGLTDSLLKKLERHCDKSSCMT